MKEDFEVSESSLQALQQRWITQGCTPTSSIPLSIVYTISVTLVSFNFPFIQAMFLCFVYAVIFQTVAYDI